MFVLFSYVHDYFFSSGLALSIERKLMFELGSGRPFF